MAWSNLSPINSLSLHLLHLLLTTLGLLLLPLILATHGVCLFSRFLVAKWVKYLDPSMGEMLPPANAIVAAHTPYSNPASITSSIQYVSGGRISKAKVIRVISQNVISPKATGGGVCLYPELKQRVVSRLGFLFWKPVDKFSLEDHVSYFQVNGVEPEMDGKACLELLAKLTHSPFSPSRSPWEFLLVRNFEDASRPNVSSAVIFRGHHCFFDGISSLNFMNKLASVPMSLPVAAPTMVSKGFTLSRLTWEILRLPLSLHELIRSYVYSDRNYWTKQFSLQHKNAIVAGETPLVSLSELKEAKTRFGVSFSTLVYTVFARGVMRLMEAKGELVSKANLATTVLLPDHPDRLLNHYSFSIMPLNLEGNMDIAEMMEEVDSQLQQSRRLPRSTQITGFPAIQDFLGSFPLPYVIHPRDAPTATMALTNFQGSKYSTDYCGYPAEEYSCMMTPPPSVGFTCVAFSYQDSFKWTVFGDRSLFPGEEDMELMLEGMGEALDELMAENKLYSNKNF